MSSPSAAPIGRGSCPGPELSGPPRPARIAPRGTSLVGILVSMTIIVVLAAVLLSALNKAVTGAGNTTAGSVRSMEDQLQLNQIAMACFIAGQDQGKKGPPAPSDLIGGTVADTTANAYSLLVMQKYVDAPTLVSKNERNPVVFALDGYDYGAYDPTAKRFWDARFKADLKSGSNASYAHVPLFGRRARYWREVTLDSSFPIMGTRGPKEGKPDPNSLTYGRDGTWGGFQVYGDGHVAFVESFVVPGRALENGEPDNAFAIDGPVDGGDAVLAFTRIMNGDGPRLEWD